jgi:hypothetical protein
MPISVSPVASVLFATPAVAETERPPDRQHPHDDGRRRHQEHPETDMMSADIESPPTRGTLIDVQA